MGPEMSLSEVLKAPLISAPTDLFSGELAQAGLPCQALRKIGTPAASLAKRRGESIRSEFEDTQETLAEDALHQTK